MKTGIVILGAGISGIAAGYFLGKNKASIFESKDRYGGLCDSFELNNFIFDTAVHLSFTPYSQVREVFDKTPYYTHEPDPVNYYKGYWLKHPLQNNLYALPTEEKVKAIVDFIHRPFENKEPDNYEEWLYQQFGKYLADTFPSVYTRKYWCEKANKLETEWVKSRVYRPTLNEVLQGAMTNKTPITYYAKEMRYPTKGGYKSFLEPMAKESNIYLNKTAILIDPKNKFVEFSDGSKVYYQSLISSIPLPEIIKLIKDAPYDVINASQELISTSMLLVSVGFKTPEAAKNLWFYIYDEDLLPARAYSPSKKSTNNAPKGCSSLQFEIYYSKFKPLLINNDDVLEHIRKLIKKLNISNENDIMFMNCKKAPYANVIFYKNIYKNKKIVQNYLDKLGIKYIGRFGEWDYLWSDQSLLSGKKAAKELLEV